MTQYRIIVTSAAREDLQGIYTYIAQVDGPDKANHVFQELRKVVKSLGRFPLRGPHPPELLATGNNEFRELFFKPYRVIYEIMGETVLVHLIADGRRDMRALFQRRLLES
jgi:toxin ParE1/3/4